MTNRRNSQLFLALLTLLAALKLGLILCTPYTLAPDEAHYWEWSRRLDWAYYSKGPLVALLIRGGTAVFGDTASAVRLPAFVCWLLFAILAYCGTRMIASPRGALAAFIFLNSLLFFIALGLGMTTDPPCLLFWLAGLLAACKAVQADDARLWPAVALLLGMAALAKYTAVILPLGIGLYLLSQSNLRRHLVSRHFAAAVIIYLLCLFPVAYWNFRHDWVNLAHNSGHLVDPAAPGFKPQHFIELLLSQWALTGPLFFPLIIVLLLHVFRSASGARDQTIGLLVFSALPLALLCAVVSFTKSVYANWPMPLYVHAGLLAALWAEHASPAFCRWARRAVLVNAVLALPVLAVLGGPAFGLPLWRTPLKKLVGWERLGLTVAELQRRHEELTFIVADDYGVSSEIAFYTPGHPPVLSWRPAERRMNQYDIWGGWENHTGKNALIVVKQPELERDLMGRFREVLPLDERLEIKLAGRTVRTFYFFRGLGFDGVAPSAPIRY